MHPPTDENVHEFQRVCRDRFGREVAFDEGREMLFTLMQLLAALDAAPLPD